MKTPGKLLIALAIANLLALPALAGGPKKRTHVVKYVAPGSTTLADGPYVGTYDRFNRLPAVGIMGADPGDSTRVKIQLRDATGRPAAVRVLYVKPGKDEYAQPAPTLCSGKTPILKINTKYTVVAVVLVGPCDGNMSAPTTGTATFTFFK